MRIGGQSVVILALAIMPVSVMAKDKSAPARIDGNPGSYFGVDAYPAEAIRAAEQGRVVAAVAVDATGAPTGCTTATSSGSTSLDAATCAIAMAKTHYSPALDAKGRPTTGTYKLAVRWVLPVEESPAQRHSVSFSGTAAAPVCAVVIDGAMRHLVPTTCRALAGAVAGQGTNLPDVNVSILIGAGDLLPPGE